MSPCDRMHWLKRSAPARRLARSVALTVAPWVYWRQADSAARNADELVSMPEFGPSFGSWSPWGSGKFVTP